MWRLSARFLAGALAFALGAGATTLLHRLTETWPADAVPAPPLDTFRPPAHRPLPAEVPVEPLRGTCENAWLSLGEFEVFNGGKASPGRDIIYSEGHRLARRAQAIHPPEARAARISGTVELKVVFDRWGSVTKAFAVSGHPLLRPAAVHAACRSRFEPLDTVRRVSVVTPLTYEFILD